MYNINILFLLLRFCMIDICIYTPVARILSQEDNACPLSYGPVHLSLYRCTMWLRLPRIFLCDSIVIVYNELMQESFICLVRHFCYRIRRVTDELLFRALSG